MLYHTSDYLFEQISHDGESWKKVKFSATHISPQIIT